MCMSYKYPWIYDISSIIFPRTPADHSSLPLYHTHVELLQAPASDRSCRYFWRSASVKPFLGDL